MSEQDQKPRMIDLLNLLDKESQALKNRNRALGVKIADTIVEKYNDCKTEAQEDIQSHLVNSKLFMQINPNN